MRLKREERNIRFLSSGHGCFQAAFFLGDKAIAAARKPGITQEVNPLIKGVQRYPAGHAIRFDGAAPRQRHHSEAQPIKLEARRGSWNTPLLTALPQAINVSNERSIFTPMFLSVPHSRDTSSKLEHILRHSARIFAEKGFAGASVRDISRATGISLSGLYYYFDSKQKLLYLIQHNTFMFVLARLQSRLPGASDPLSRLRILISNHIEYFLSHPNEMKVLSHEEDALKEPLHAEVAALKRKYYGLARKLFDDVAAAGIAPGLNPRVAVLSLFGMMNWVYKWHNPQVDPGPAELTDDIVRIFLYGVLPSGVAVKEVSQGAAATVP